MEREKWFGWVEGGACVVARMCAVADGYIV